MARALILIDPKVPKGCYEIGGAVILNDLSDEDLGFAITAKPIRVHDDEQATDLEAEIERRGGESRRVPV